MIRKWIIFLVLFAVFQFTDTKRVDVTLEPNWFKTPLLLETSEFFSEKSNDFFWDFVESLPENGVSQDDATLLGNIAGLTKSEEGLLKLLATTHYYSPLVTLHQQLAQAVLQDLAPNGTSCTSFVVLNDRKLFCDPNELLKIELNEESPQASSVSLNREHIYPSALPEDKQKGKVVLYSHIGTPEFTRFHQILKELSKNRNLKYFYRHYFTQSTETVTLQGYGVELLLKSTEYKAIDDTKVETDSSKVNEREVEEEEVEGFLFRKLIERKPHLRSELLTFKDLLLQKEDLSIEKMKKWQLKDLGFLAAQRIIQSGEPLRALRDISQNFLNVGPSIAQTQLDTTVTEPFLAYQNKFLMPGYSIGSLNGRVVDPDTTDFYKFITQVKDQVLLGTLLQNLSLPVSTVSQVLKAASAQSSSQIPRFDIRSDVILYFNDLERDNRYKSFPPSLRSVKQGQIHGQFRYVRKNLITVDFLLECSLEALDVLESISVYLRRFVPFRFGVAFYCDDPASAQCDFVKLFKLFFNTDPDVALQFAIHMRDFFDLDGTLSRESLYYAYDAFSSGDYNSAISSPDLDEYLDKSIKFFKKTGLSPKTHSLPAVFVNGQYEPLEGGSVLEKAFNLAMKDTQLITNMIMKSEIDDNTDIIEHLFSVSATFKGFHSLALSPHSAQISLHSFPSISYLNTTSSQLFNELKYFHNPNFEQNVKPLTLLVVTDFAKPSALSLVSSTLNAIKLEELGSLMRVGFIQKTKEGDVSPLLFKSLVAAAQTQTSSKLAAFVEKLLVLITSSEEVTKSQIEEAASLVNFSKKWLDSLNNSPYWEQLIQTHSEWAIHTLPSSTSSAFVLNGRVIELAEGQEMNENFVDFLSRFQYKSYFKTVSDIIEASQLVDVDADILTSEYLSDVIQKACSLIPPMSDQTIKIPDFQSSFEVKSEEALINIDLFVDPLSKAAQRFTPILIELEHLIPLNLRIFLNPVPNLSELPLTSYYRFVLSSTLEKFSVASFSSLPLKRLLTLGLDTPESWLVQPVEALHDLDNILLGDIKESSLSARFQLEHLLVQGRCVDNEGDIPRGLQLVLKDQANVQKQADTLVLYNLGYFQLKANPGLWSLEIAEGRHSLIYSFLDKDAPQKALPVLLSHFSGTFLNIEVTKNLGQQDQELLPSTAVDMSMWKKMSQWMGSLSESSTDDKGNQTETLHIFSVASGRLYERFLKIMMLSVVKHTTGPVKFWFLQNVLSPDFKDFLPEMAKKYGFEVELVTYQWPFWLNKQKEKQRTIWGYKILFLDVLFPLNVKKIIFVDADLVVRSDLRELWNLDLEGAPLAFTPFCDSNKETEGFRFWKQGFWKDHLAGKPYHISALYVVDLELFRLLAAGDKFRSTYEMLSRDANSLANLDQDLPNYLQSQVPIYSLPQDWLYCETWCHNSTKKTAKAIDLCNNPMTKTPKLENAVRIIDEWTSLDNEAKSIQSKDNALQNDAKAKEEKGSVESPKGEPIRPVNSEKEILL